MEVICPPRTFKSRLWGIALYFTLAEAEIRFADESSWGQWPPNMCLLKSAQCRCTNSVCRALVGSFEKHQNNQTQGDTMDTVLSSWQAATCLQSGFDRKRRGGGLPAAGTTKWDDTRHGGPHFQPSGVWLILCPLTEPFLSFTPSLSRCVRRGWD